MQSLALTLLSIDKGSQGDALPVGTCSCNSGRYNIIFSKWPHLSLSDDIRSLQPVRILGKHE